MNEHHHDGDDRSRRMLQAFREYLNTEGLKSTRQRDLIAEEFARVEDHVSVDELLARVREKDSAVGYATVYRTLKLLVDARLALLRNFGEGFARYEPRSDQHHDHIICELCGRIEEFHDAFIEERQAEVAKGLGYRLTQHRHELFGVCASCLQKHGESVVTPLDRRHAENRVSPSELPDAFRGFLVREGLKSTRQRDLITSLFAQTDDHVSVEDLLERVKKEDTSIGYATVYRTLKLLVEAGLASCRHFGDGFTRFEPRSQHHHDHFIDEETGRVIEFHDEAIERRQEEVAQERGYRLVRHRHDLFGRRLESSP